MKLTIQAVNFEMAQSLEDFIQKKTRKLLPLLPDSETMVVHLKLVKPQTNLNKQVQIRLGDAFVSKVCDTFEQSFQQCIDVIERHIEQSK